jgi:hypothetical protein
MFVYEYFVKNKGSVFVRRLHTLPFRGSRRGLFLSWELEELSI